MKHFRLRPVLASVALAGGLLLTACGSDAKADTPAEQPASTMTDNSMTDSTMADKAMTDTSAP
jgi:hypothetical protein